MRPLHFIVGLGGLFLFAAPAQAGEQTAGGVAAPSPAPTGDSGKLICRRPKVTGSRLPGPRVCRTAEQWRNANTEDQDAVRNFQKNRGVIAP